MARLREIVVDCAHPATVARFWAAALDDYEVAPYDEAELERLRGMGINDPEDDPNVLVQPTVLVEPTGPRLPLIFFQLVPEGKVAKNRVHLDICSADPAEQTRLIALGATVLYDADGFTALADPEGNEFCLQHRD